MKLGEHNCQFILRAFPGGFYSGAPSIAVDYDDTRYECCGRIARNKLDSLGEDFAEWLCDEHYATWLNHEAQ